MRFQDAPNLPGFIASLFPLERRIATLEHGPDRGKRVHLVDDGPRGAPVVVMLHGNPTWSFLWRKVITALPAGRFRCIAPDLLGLGLSDRLTMQEHSLQRHIDALHEVVVAAAPAGPIILVGQDWGGPIAAGIGAAIPDRIAGIVLGNTSVIAPTRPRGTAFHRFSQLPIVSDLVFRGFSFPQRGMGLVQGDRRSISGPVARAYRWPLRHFADRIAPLAMARMVPNSPHHPTLAALRTGEAFVTAFDGPCALVWGTRDPILGRALRRHEALLPRAPVTLTRAGHFLQEEVPEALAAAIVDVADRHDVVAARRAAD